MDADELGSRSDFSAWVEELDTSESEGTRAEAIENLRRAAAESEEQLWRVVDVLVSHVRAQCSIELDPETGLPAAHGRTSTKNRGILSRESVARSLMAIGALLAHAEESSMESPSEIELSGLDFSALRVEKREGDGMVFRDVNFARSNFRGAYFFHADFGSAKFGKADLSGGHFNGGSFAGAKLGGARLAGAGLVGVSFARAQMQGACLRGARLDQNDFTGARLTSSDLRDCNLFGATFVDTTFTGADLRGAKLAGIARESYGSLDARGSLFARLAEVKCWDTDTSWPPGFSMPARRESATDCVCEAGCEAE